MIKFNNKPNECIIHEGKEYWISRSVAVMGIIIFLAENDKIYVLGEKRSELMDSPGKWCVPSGYIDWDENGSDSLIREVYEETGIYLPDLGSVCLSDKNDPFYVHTELNENRQNIVLCYSRVYNISMNVKLRNMVFDSQRFESDETDMIKLIDIENIAKYDWAFNHDERIRAALFHEGIRRANKNF